MKREVRNYIFIGCGFLVIILLCTWHLLDEYNNLLFGYNQFIRFTNTLHNTNYSENYVYYFGNGTNDISLLVDLILYFVIFMIGLMVFLKIYWSIKYQEKTQ